MAEVVIGTVSDFFARLSVAGIESVSSFKSRGHNSHQGAYYRYHDDS